MKETAILKNISAADYNNGYRAPFIMQRADPFVTRYDGIYYFTASVPEYDRVELRAADTVGGLAVAAPKIIWKKHESGIMSENVWAPELHRIDGAWYIYFAAGEKDNKWEIRPYVLTCTGDPMKDEWRELGQLQPSAGDKVSFTDFSLDVTVFENKGRRYFVWAEKIGRQFGVSNIYIAEMESPRRLKTERVLLSTPEYDWERIGFLVNEGPAVLKRNGRIFITYSASATGAMYCMGMLGIDENADLLNPALWHKELNPVLKTDRTKGFYGPGHNSFSVNEYGEDICIFHAREYEEITGDPLYDPNRHTLITKIKYGESGKPLLEMPDRK